MRWSYSLLYTILSFLEEDGLFFLQEHPSALFHAWRWGNGSEVRRTEMGSLAEARTRLCCLCLVDNNVSSTQTTSKSPVVVSPEQCHADTPSNKDYCPSCQLLQGLPQLQRAALLNVLLFPGWQHPTTDGGRVSQPKNFRPLQPDVG